MLGHEYNNRSHLCKQYEVINYLHSESCSVSFSIENVEQLLILMRCVAFCVHWTIEQRSLRFPFNMYIHKQQIVFIWLSTFSLYCLNFEFAFLYKHRQSQIQRQKNRLTDEKRKMKAEWNDYVHSTMYVLFELKESISEKDENESEII